MGNCWPKSQPVENLPSTDVSANKASPAKNDDFPAKNDDFPATGEVISSPNLKIFSLSELKKATRNFRLDTVVGEGGFGRVFRGYIDPKTYAPSKVGYGIPVAVKKSNPHSQQGLKEWQAEVTFLGKFSHPNLVKLLGYCWEDRQFLLVYEYMQKGSLESHLFRKGGGEPIPWDLRVKIVIGAARGLAFLHSTEKQVIYRDFKASNILLDMEYNAKLSDFGLAKLGPIDGNSHVTTIPMGTYGYAAPEYMDSGHLYVKSDVYGFGVVLLEILTGLRVLDQSRPRAQLNLVKWAIPLINKNRWNKLTDPQLVGQCPPKAVSLTGDLILRCLDGDPKRRPGMDEVLLDLEHISSIQMTPKELKTYKSKQNQHHQPLHHSHSEVVGGAGKGDGHGKQKNLMFTRSY